MVDTTREDPPAPAGTHRVRIVDIPLTRVRRPVDLVLMIISLVAVVGMLALSVYARGTTTGVTQDVQSAFSSVVRGILLVPVTVIEGLLTIVLPIVVIVERLLRRNPRAVVEAIGSAAAAYLIARGSAWLIVAHAPDRLLRSLQIWQDGSLVLSISPSVAALAALLTTTGIRASNRAVKVSWTLLWIALTVSVITGDSTIVGSLSAVLLGRAVGLGMRYAVGVLSGRVHGDDLVDAIRRAGVDPVSIVRIGQETSSDDLRLEFSTGGAGVGYAFATAAEPISDVTGAPSTLTGSARSLGIPNGRRASAADADVTAETHAVATTGAEETASTPSPDSADRRVAWSLDEPPSDPTGQNAPDDLTDQDDSSDPTVERIVASLPDPATVTMEREGWNRVYAIEASDGRRWDAIVLDEDRQVMGLLSQAWTVLRLRGMGRRSATNLRQAADRAALMSYAAEAAGVNTPRLHGIAENRASVVLVGEHVSSARSLDDVGDDALTDEVMASAWRQLLTAHAAGLSHRNLSGESVLLVEADDGPQVWLSGWEQGDIASPSLTRRIDLFQLLALFSLRVGVERAVAAAHDVLPAEELAALAPVVQRVVLPPGLQAAARGDKETLRGLRTALASFLPDEGELIEPLKLTRFSARTIVMTTIAIVAGWILLTTLNFHDIVERMSQAEPGWLVAAFVFGLLTYLGSGMGLVAFTPERLGLWRSTLVQVAASVIVLVAPAGVGPAAINLRFLQRQRIKTPMAIATVALLQVSQFVTTVLLLIVIALLTGSSGALSQLPSQTIIIVLLALAVVIGIVVAIPSLRRFLAAKLMPTLRQVWPRVLWVAGQPGRLILGIGGNLLMTIGYLASFALTLRAFGFTLPLTTLTLVYLTGNTIGAAVPTPGGMGAIEAALSTGLKAAGIGTAVSLSTAVIFRVLNFWIPVPMGWFALRHLQKRGDL